MTPLQLPVQFTRNVLSGMFVFPSCLVLNHPALKLVQYVHEIIIPITQIQPYSNHHDNQVTYSIHKLLQFIPASFRTWMPKGPQLWVSILQHEVSEWRQKEKICRECHRTDKVMKIIIMARRVYSRMAGYLWGGGRSWAVHRRNSLAFGGILFTFSSFFLW